MAASSSANAWALTLSSMPFGWASKRVDAAAVPNDVLVEDRADTPLFMFFWLLLNEFCLVFFFLRIYLIHMRIRVFIGWDCHRWRVCVSVLRAQFGYVYFVVWFCVACVHCFCVDLQRRKEFGRIFGCGCCCCFVVWMNRFCLCMIYGGTKLDTIQTKYIKRYFD